MVPYDRVTLLQVGGKARLELARRVRNLHPGVYGHLPSGTAPSLLFPFLSP